jgi:N-acetylglucosamine-6-phosphate deacetylase
MDADADLVLLDEQFKVLWMMLGGKLAFVQN